MSSTSEVSAVDKVRFNDYDIHNDIPPKGPQQKKRRVCYYNIEWEKQYDWVANCPEDTTKAKCQICSVTFTVAYDGVDALKSHVRSKRHGQCVQTVAISPRMHSFFCATGMPQSDKVTLAELTQVYHGVKHHSSYLQQDCSVKVLKTVVDDSDIVRKMSCGRTKATSMINNVLYPFALEYALVRLRTGMPFSIATDACNKGSHKFFPVGVQYFTPEDGICFSIIDFYEDSFEDSRSVKDHLNQVLEDTGLSWANVSAYGADNASVNYSVNNSVYQKLTSKENKSIIQAHCNDHVLHNCAKNALNTISFDIENLVLKVFSHFSNSATRCENLKDCFDFCQAEFHEVIRHVPTRWLSLFKAVEQLLLNWEPLKSYFLALGADECPRAIWKVVKDQEHEMAPADMPTISELYIHFVHFFMSSFQDTVLKLETKSTTACDLFTIMDKFHNMLQTRERDQFFGMKVKLALRKNYLLPATAKAFIVECLTVYKRAITYLEKWFNFNSSPYQTFKCFGIGGMSEAPSLDDVLDVWSSLRSDEPPEVLHDEINALATLFSTLQGDTGEKWSCFFKKEKAPNLLKLLQHILSIPVSNASVEHVFSIMGNIWTDESNRLTVGTACSELTILFNLPYTCMEFKTAVTPNKRLIKAAQSGAKYKPNLLK